MGCLGVVAFSKQLPYRLPPCHRSEANSLGEAPNGASLERVVGAIRPSPALFEDVVFSHATILEQWRRDWDLNPG